MDPQKYCCGKFMNGTRYISIAGITKRNTIPMKKALNLLPISILQILE